MNMEKDSRKNMDITFMLVPLNAAEKRKIKRRKINGGEPVVFVEPSTSTKKRLEAKAPSEQVPTSKKSKGPSKKPVVFLDKLASTKAPEANITFGSPSTQKKPVLSGQCSASKEEVGSRSTEKTSRKQKEPFVSTERPSKKEMAKAASKQPAIQSRMNKRTKQREHKGKAPSKDSTTPSKATLPRVTKKEVVSLVRNIVDKLTVENFRDLMAQLQDVTVDSEERLSSVVNLVFEKAMSRPDSSALYANMCRCLSKMIVPGKDLKLPGSFHTLLIRRCQAEFVENFEQRQREDEEEHRQLKTGLDEAEASSRSVSNIKFVAELFRIKMLGEAAVHSCIQRLLSNQDEGSLECLCHLLKSIGKELELLTPKKTMDGYFRKVADVIQQGRMSPRVSDLLKGTLDLRQRNWIPESIDRDQIIMEGERPGDCSDSLSPSSSGHSDACQTSAVGQSESAVCKEEPAVPSQDADSSSAQDSEEGHLFDDLKQDEQQDDDSQPELSPHPLTEDEMENLSEAVIDRCLKVDNFKEALHVISRLNSPSVLHVFVRNAVDLTFQCSGRTRRQVGLLLLELIRSGVLHIEQLFKGLREILEVADYISTDFPEIWLCLAEVLSPVLHEGGVSMAELFGEIQTRMPPGPAGVLMTRIHTILPGNTSEKTI